MLLLAYGLLSADTHEEREHFLLELLFKQSDVLHILCMQFVGVVSLDHANNGWLLLFVLVFEFENLNLLFLNLLLNANLNILTRT